MRMSRAGFCASHPLPRHRDPGQTCDRKASGARHPCHYLRLPRATLTVPENYPLRPLAEGLTRWCLDREHLECWVSLRHLRVIVVLRDHGKAVLDRGRGYKRVG